MKNDWFSNLRGNTFGKWPPFHCGLVLHVLDLLLQCVLIHGGEYTGIHGNNRTPLTQVKTTQRLRLHRGKSILPGFTALYIHIRGTRPTHLTVHSGVTRYMANSLFRYPFFSVRETTAASLVLVRPVESADQIMQFIILQSYHFLFVLRTEHRDAQKYCIFVRFFLKHLSGCKRFGRSLK